MPEVIVVKGDRPEVIFTARDFEELMDTHMGLDCAKFYRNQIEQLSECIRSLANYIDDDLIQAEIEEVLEIHGY